jgi:hypothetical protein
MRIPDSLCLLRLLPLLAAGGVALLPGMARAKEDAASKERDDAFFALVDKGGDLPEDRIYPEGRIFPYMGYSGKNKQDAASGFSVGGPHYGPQSGQKDKLASAKEAGLSYVYGIGLEGGFTRTPPIQFTADSLRKEIRRQVLEVAADPAVAWWYVRPEELRMWHANEKEYLGILTETIRAADPRKRPIWMYDPNHRTRAALVTTGEYLDIIGKGSYVNLAGFRDDRVWVRWSMEQETGACRDLEAKDGRKRTPILVPLLAKDPQDPALDPMIPAWIRHDVYLGLISGAKGVAIWSLFPRGEVRRTFQTHYDIYAKIARELTGHKALGQVFLFGEDRHDLTVKQTRGPKTVTLFTGPRNKLEEGTMSEEEKRRHTHEYPALAAREIVFSGNHYLFLCNSSRAPVSCEITGFPAGKIRVEDLFAGKPFAPSSGVLQIDLKSWGAQAIRVSR